MLRNGILFYLNSKKNLIVGSMYCLALKNKILPQICIFVSQGALVF